MVRAKKHLGQHFLRDESIAQRTADALQSENCDIVLEIGPGMGVLTKYLLKREDEIYVIEIDRESVLYLKEHYPVLQNHIIEKDFLKFDLERQFPEMQLAIIGNFPYNISSQILFKVLENYRKVPEVCGMFQKEVAERVCEKPGSKAYGILSVLVQAYYKTEYLFSVPPEVFSPPPKVMSGVIRLTRKQIIDFGCDERLFKRVVKTAFNQRRKTLRNSLKAFDLSDNLKANVIFGERPERLGVHDFIRLTNLIAADG
ncbi:MAG: 16S rRNA (adenine(1518)-N(6)/adenine(1519)-N(6))-dimethyltransferase RsmA [Flavobacteriaceae bacterium]|nr:16S rRNA (adenine(1518)-N(6)/adenine(1519)-N(6))-dimethyltransferase RsmA [Bacteroidia bacterium]NNK88173.1 16S rRNA (adenine(1518)-N(6)/adenine(1519)-N(6))-dimethyltransferase RsmA [Flavobacteriaceae bacterium]